MSRFCCPVSSLIPWSRSARPRRWRGADLARLRITSKAGHRGAARVRAISVVRMRSGRGLARAVTAEQRAHAAGRNPQAHLPQRLGPAEGLGQPIGPDRVLGHDHPLRRRTLNAYVVSMRTQYARSTLYACQARRMRQRVRDASRAPRLEHPGPRLEHPGPRQGNPRPRQGNRGRPRGSRSGADTTCSGSMRRIPRPPGAARWTGPGSSGRRSVSPTPRGSRRSPCAGSPLSWGLAPCPSTGTSPARRPWSAS